MNECSHFYSIPFSKLHALLLFSVVAVVLLLLQARITHYLPFATTMHFLQFINFLSPALKWLKHEKFGRRNGVTQAKCCDSFPSSCLSPVSTIALPIYTRYANLALCRSCLGSEQNCIFFGAKEKFHYFTYSLHMYHISLSLLHYILHMCTYLAFVSSSVWVSFVPPFIFTFFQKTKKKSSISYFWWFSGFILPGFHICHSPLLQLYPVLLLFSLQRAKYFMRNCTRFCTSYLLSPLLEPFRKK